MSSPDPGFAVQVLHQDGSLTLRLTGELDVATVPVLRRSVAELVSPHLRAVTVDMGGLDFVDLVGLEGIYEVKLTVAAAGAEFKLRAVSELALRVMQIVDLEDLLGAIDPASAPERSAPGRSELSRQASPRPTVIGPALRGAAGCACSTPTGSAPPIGERSARWAITSP